MGNKIYVGSLAFSATEESLAAVFAKYGEVSSVKIITDRDTGRSKGFAFVEMSTDEQAKSAIAELNGKEFEGRPMNVSEARPQQPRDNRRGGGGGGGGYGRGRR